MAAERFRGQAGLREQARAFGFDPAHPSQAGSSMIRDPSDGSEYDIPKPILEIGTSGLQTGSQKPENLERLEKSRNWLKEYRERKALSSQAE